MHRSLGLSALAAAWLLLSSSVAVAADTPLSRGIDPVGAKPATGHGGFLATEGGQVATARSYKLDLLLDYTSGLMAFQIGDEKVGNLIERRLDLHLLAAYALTDWAEVGLDVPLTAWQANGFAQLEESTGFADARPDSWGLGDVRAVGKVRLLSELQAPVTAALLFELRLPTGKDQSFLGERGLLLAPRAVVERTLFEKLRLAFEAGYRFRSQPGRYLNLYVGDELTAGMAGSWELPKWVFERWNLFGELLVATPARAPFNGPSDALKTPVELLLGTRAHLFGNLHALLGAGTGLAMQSGFGRESLRVFAALQYERIFHDRDGDGIADEDDRCPDQAEDRDGFEDSDGCPDPDNDKDGIPDAQDRCPDKAGPKAFEGCPDSDKDGVPDHLDRCPAEPGEKEYDGCPDKDGDDVPDVDDKCPETAGAAADDGCPGKPLVVLEKKKLVIKGAINFDSGKASIKKESFPVLDEVAKILAGHQEIKRVVIEGHTDDVGAAAFNRDLSKRRAQSVVRYLVDKGTEAPRLDANGWGEEKPVAPNTSPLGRAKNRRVEFIIVE